MVVVEARVAWSCELGQRVVDVGLLVGGESVAAAAERIDPRGVPGGVDAAGYPAAGQRDVVRSAVADVEGAKRRWSTAAPWAVSRGCAVPRSATAHRCR